MQLAQQMSNMPVVVMNQNQLSEMIKGVLPQGLTQPQQQSQPLAHHQYTPKGTLRLMNLDDIEDEVEKAKKELKEAM